MIYSPVCNNPRQGFSNKNGCQSPNARVGYWVLDDEEMYEAFHNKEWYERLKRLQDGTQ